MSADPNKPPTFIPQRLPDNLPLFPSDHSGSVEDSVESPPPVNLPPGKDYLVPVHSTRTPPYNPFTAALAYTNPNFSVPQFPVFGPEPRTPAPPCLPRHSPLPEHLHPR